MKLNRLKTLLSGILAGALLMALAFGFAVSADASNWVTITTWAAAQTTAGTLLTTTVLPGAYLRNVATIGNANPITFSVKCVIKNSST